MKQAVQFSVSKQGRIVIPAILRAQLNVKAGTRLIAWVEDGQLILKPATQLWASIRKETQKFPAGRDLVQELIHEHREATKGENACEATRCTSLSANSKIAFLNT